MIVNVEGLQEILQENFEGDCEAFAKTVGVDANVLCRLLKGNAIAGLKTTNRLKDYIESLGYDMEDYFIAV